MDVEQEINIAVFWKNTSRKHQKWRKKPEKGTKNSPFRFDIAVVSGGIRTRNTGILPDLRQNEVDFVRIRVYIIYSMFFRERTLFNYGNETEKNIPLRHRVR